MEMGVYEMFAAAIGCVVVGNLLTSLVSDAVRSMRRKRAQFVEVAPECVGIDAVDGE